MNMGMRFSGGEVRDAQAPDEPLPPTPRAERQWTSYQQAVLDHFQRSSRSAVVVARAGAGKTTVALEGVRRAPERSVLLTSFSKSAVENLKPRAPGWATCTSLHGVGLRIIGRRWRGTDVDNKGRARSLAVAACPPGTSHELLRLVENLHTKVREINPWARTVEEVADVANDYDVVPASDLLNEVAAWSLRAVELAEQRTDKVDFADMLFLPIRHDWIAPQYDLVVDDECQDTSTAQLAIARGVCGGRMVVIGDDRQAIYKWRGAEADSLDRMEGELDADRLLMPETFRCGRAIVEEARRIVHDFNAHSSVGDGLVRAAGLDQVVLEADPGEGRDQGDFILSRTNAPLVGIALRLLRQDKKCRIMGRDVAAGLLGLTNRLGKRCNDGTDVWTFVDAAWDWFAREEARARDSQAQSAKRRVARVRDQVDMLEALAEGLSTLGDLRRRIETVFADDGSGRGVRLGTVHAVKGLEARRVYLLSETFSRPVSCLCNHFASAHLFPGGACRNCDKCDGYQRDVVAAVEEENIKYVAITRAKEVLTWVY